MSNPIVNALRRLGLWLRDGWLMIGVVLLMLVALEAAYRAQSDLRHAISAKNDLKTEWQPYADSAWFADYLREYDQTFMLRWRSYVYFRRPAFTGRFINVDPAGHRRTVPLAQPAADTIRVFCFGGSTMWGTYLRDAATVASVTAQRLAAAGPPGVTFDVTNFGEGGYVFTQEVLELELQLRTGHIPDVVVFYDGLNDVASAAQRGEVGVPQNEGNRVREFDIGRTVYATETGTGSEFRAMGTIVGEIAQRVQLFQRIFALAARPANPARTPEQLGPDIAHIYANTASLVEALSHAYGFKVLYVWQPLLSSTTKNSRRSSNGWPTRANTTGFASASARCTAWPRQSSTP